MITNGGSTFQNIGVTRAYALWWEAKLGGWQGAVGHAMTQGSGQEPNLGEWSKVFTFYSNGTLCWTVLCALYVSWDGVIKKWLCWRVQRLYCEDGGFNEGKRHIQRQELSMLSAGFWGLGKTDSFHLKCPPSVWPPSQTHDTIQRIEIATNPLAW